jgi:hypothetical protein
MINTTLLRVDGHIINTTLSWVDGHKINTLQRVDGHSIYDA